MKIVFKYIGRFDYRREFEGVFMDGRSSVDVTQSESSEICLISTNQSSRNATSTPI